MDIRKKFAKYVSQNIFGMLGISCYVVADTFFISKFAGADGITVLNLVLPVFNVIFAVGSMIGVGSAIRFKILRAKNDERADDYFSNAIMCACHLNTTVLFLPRKCVRHTNILHTGEAAVAIAAPNSPSFIGNINI
jgi:Na+-driven multidrug efflux pump